VGCILSMGKGLVLVRGGVACSAVGGGLRPGAALVDVRQSPNGVSEEHAVRRVTKSVHLVKSVHACLLLTSHVKAECIGCLVNDFSRSFHMTNAP
jgi:hypothetical protein